MLFSGYRYEKLKFIHESFASRSFADAVSKQPYWQEAHYDSEQDSWTVYNCQRSILDNPAQKAQYGSKNGGRANRDEPSRQFICESQYGSDLFYQEVQSENLSFKAAVKCLKDFEKAQSNSDQRITDDVHLITASLEDAESILNAQKFSIRQKICGNEF